MIVNYKNAYEELKRLYERLEKENARLKDKLIEIKKVIDGYMPNEYAMCDAFDEIEFIIKENQSIIKNIKINDKIII